MKATRTNDGSCAWSAIAGSVLVGAMLGGNVAYLCLALMLAAKHADRNDSR
jgi:hypothetical protein